ncbi:hypothetical protein FDZ71_07025, partial [bacterium]
MKKNAALILALILAGVALAATQEPLPAGGFHEKMECVKCHFTNYTLDCDQCHDKGINPHPLGIKPTMAVPASLPLDKDGNMVCKTCHKIHGGNKAASYLRNGDPFFSARRAFCFKCHKEGMTGTNPHDAGGGPSRCLFCHDQEKCKDGGTKLAVRKPVDSTCRFCHGASDAGHAGLMGMNAPPPVEGHVNCVSCHDPHGTFDSIYNLRPEVVESLGRTQEKNPHTEEPASCVLCHTKRFPDEIRTAPKKLLYGGNLVMLCLSCHVTVRGHH